MNRTAGFNNVFLTTLQDLIIPSQSRDSTNPNHENHVDSPKFNILEIRTKRIFAFEIREMIIVYFQVIISDE